MTRLQRFGPGWRRALGAVMAATLAAGMTAPAPARADADDLVKVIAGIAAVAVIGRAIERRNDLQDKIDAKDEERARKSAEEEALWREEQRREGRLQRLWDGEWIYDDAGRDAGGAAGASRRASDWNDWGYTGGFGAGGGQEWARDDQSLSRWESSDPGWTGPTWPGVAGTRPLDAVGDPVPRDEGQHLAGRRFRDDHPVFGTASARPPVGNARFDDRVVPASCLVTHQTRGGPVEVLGDTCLVRNYRNHADLPQACLRALDTTEGRKYGHDQSCLWREGFVIAGRQ